MSDNTIDKLRELFNELLSDYETNEHDLIAGFGGDEEAIEKTVAAYRQRFDEIAGTNSTT